MNKQTETMPETYASDISDFIQSAVAEFTEGVEEFENLELEAFSEADDLNTKEGFFIFYGGKRFTVSISEQ